MKIGTVIGTLEPARSAPGFEDVRWLQVRVGQRIAVAADLVTAQAGQTVVLAEGSAARNCQMTCPADLIAVAVIGE